MKVFKKWKKEFCSHRCCSGTSSCGRCNTDHEVAWRAALEWVLENAGWDDYCNITTIERADIEDELELDK